MYRQQGFDSFGTSTHKDNIGYFVEKEHKHEFTYRLTNDPWALAFGFKHECDVGYNPQEVRFCTVKKTRVIMCYDEDYRGEPMVETWVITKNVVFVK